MRESEIEQMVRFYDRDIKTLSPDHSLPRMTRWLRDSSQWENDKLYNMVRGLNAFYLELMLPMIAWDTVFHDGQTTADKVEEVALVSTMSVGLLSKLIKRWHGRLGPAITARVGDFYLTLRKRDQVWCTQTASYEGSAVRFQPVRGVAKTDEVWRELTEDDMATVDEKRRQRALPPLREYIQFNSMQPTMWNRVMIEPEQWTVGRSMLQLERVKQSVRN